MVAFLTAFSARAQLVTNAQQIPDTGKPPVIFLNGYQGGCSDKGSFAGTFGVADQILQKDGRVSLFFNNCDVPGNPAIEELGNALRDYLNGMRYVDGREVPQVDVVMHSMGGIILRCYLTGKQVQRGVFQPPATVKVRKAVFLATPFFGSLAANLSAPDIQSQELLPGSPMLFDLATWNQGRDDLRAVDSVAVVATGGTGVLNQRPGFDDSTVAVTSGSLEWVYPGRTRVVPSYCHTTLSGLLAIACQNPSSAVARMNDDQHLSARVMVSFLNGTNDWQSVGVPPAQANYLKDHAGLQVEVRGLQDEVLRVDSGQNLEMRGNDIAWTDYALEGPFALNVKVTSGPTLTGTTTLTAGSTQTRNLRTDSRQIAAVIPNFSDVNPRAVAPGSFISVYGEALAPGTAAAGGTPYPTALGGAEVLLGGQVLGLHYVSPTQINAVVPDNATGVQRLQVRTSAGLVGTNVFIEASVPSLYPTLLNAVTGALISTSAPARRGDYVAIYATGLGATDRKADGLDWARIQPVVTVGDRPCAVSYAGRAPGFVGLDQINCQVAADATVSDTAPVTVQTGSRTVSVTAPIR